LREQIQEGSTHSHGEHRGYTEKKTVGRCPL
jgi:hypothetical protein